MNTLLFSFFTIMLYGCALGTKSWQTFYKKQYSTNLKTLSLSIAGLCLHASLLYTSIFKNTQGIDLDFFNVSSLIAWFIVLMAVIAIIRKRKLDNVLFIIIPIAILCILLNDFFASQHYTHAHFSHGLLIHIILSILAYSALSLAAMQALLLFIQDTHLKKQSSPNLLRFLPSLDIMETLLFDLISFGLILLSVSILSGVFYLDDIFKQQLSHKLVFTLISWLVFTVLLIGRHYKGWRGITAVKWTLSGFIALMLAYFGSKFVLEIIL